MVSQLKKLFYGLWNGAKMKTGYDRRHLEWSDELCTLHARVLVFNIIIRFISFVYTRTEFVPDEGWQSLEVAYQVHTGKGFLTWEWHYGLRSYLYPLFMGLPMYFVDAVRSGFPMFAFSRFIQSALMVAGEQCFYHHVAKRYGLVSALFSLIILSTTWFVMFTGSRTLTNSFELALNLIALFFLYEGSCARFVFVVALNFVVRPTALIYWVAFIPEIFSLVFKSRLYFCSTVVVGFGVILVNFYVDWIHYGRPVLPWWNFFVFNFVEGRSAEFGVYPFLWYLYSAIPSILGLNILIAYGVLLTWPSRYVTDLRVIVVFIAIYSFVSHKEIRFMLPILPQFCAILGDIWAYLIPTSYFKLPATRWIVVTGFACSISAQFAASCFFMWYHQAGILPASNFVSRQASLMPQPIIWVMMPCYSLPVHMYLHHPDATYEYFTCAPQGLEYNAPNLQVGDFTDVNLTAFVQSKLVDGDTRNSPDFVLLYDYSTQVVLTALRSISDHLNYKICGNYFHTVFPFDSVGKEVEILCKLRPLKSSPEWE